jgi:hypothetical protein
MKVSGLTYSLGSGGGESPYPTGLSKPNGNIGFYLASYFLFLLMTDYYEFAADDFLGS